MNWRPGGSSAASLGRPEQTMSAPPRLTADSYLRIIAAETQRASTCRATNPAQLRVWQGRFRRRLRSLLGIDRIAARGRAALAPRRLSRTVTATHIREEWRITSEPGFALPFAVLRPLRADGPLPVAITPHGHGVDARLKYIGEGPRTHDEDDIALQAVKSGFVAIAPDMRGFASLRTAKDIADDRFSSCQTLHLRAQLLGRTLIGERTWDVQRLVDWVGTQRDCDAGRITVVGNSGGGMISLFAAALDPRIAVAMPSGYFCTFADSIGSIPHCACNFVPGMLNEAEMWDVGALIAPRPVLVIAGRHDPIFPIAATRQAFARLRSIYRMAGAEDRCRLSVSAGGHRFYAKDAWPFARRWLPAQGATSGP
jgi:dienelactone hydrolase